MKIRNLIISLLIISGLAYAGVKGYVYLKVKRQVDSLVTVAAPFVEIQYGSIGSTLEGAAHISNISLKLHGINDTIGIEQLRVITPDLAFLLAGSDSLRNGELPDRFGLQLKGVRFNLAGDLAGMLEKKEATQTQKQFAADQVCKLSYAFITAQYRELGISELVFDSEYLIERGAAPTEMQLKILFDMHGIEKTDFTLIMQGIGDSIYTIAAAVPMLKYARINYRPDPAFTDAMLKYCTAQKNMEVPAYIDYLFDEGDYFYTSESGFVPGPGIRAAFRKLIEDRGEITVLANPYSPVDISKAHLYKQEDWPRLFGLAMLVNGETVDDLSFQIQKRGTGSKNSGQSFFGFPFSGKQDAGGQTTADESQTTKTAAKTPKRSRNQYRVASAKEIPQLIGKPVRIVTYDNKLREGHILNVRNGVISLEKRVRGGTFSTRVYVKAIKTIEVLD
jgi:hypothetical protein